MKGPYERLKYDLRRLWECPVCHRKERSSFAQTYSLCSCQAKEGGGAISMQLVEDGVRRVWGEPLKKREPSAAEDVPAEESVVMKSEISEHVPFPTPEPPATAEPKD